MNKNTKKERRREAYIEKRKQLISLSVPLRQAVKIGNYDTVNEGLKDIYIENEPEITDFNTFNQWKENGFTILKGEKAYLFWGQPRKYEQVPEGETEPQEFKYFPLAYLFSNLQVVKSNNAGNKNTDQKKEAVKASEFEDLPF